MFKNYKIIEEIGRGEFGIVYKAQDSKLSRIVAIKVLRKEKALDSNAVERFLLEAKSIAALTHPHIVDIYETGQANGEYFIVMPFIEGVTLSQYLKENGKMDPAQATKLVKEIANALAHIHQLKYIHRDVKPSNILLRKIDGAAILTDFGLVKLTTIIANGVTRTDGRVLGSPPYMAPELWRGEPATPASDAYALTCVAYEALTGKSLFSKSNDETPYIIGRRHEVSVKIEDLKNIRLQKLLQSGIEKDPQKRPDIQEFATLFSEFSLFEPKRTPYTRRNLLAALGGGTLILGASGLVLSRRLMGNATPSTPIPASVIPSIPISPTIISSPTAPPLPTSIPTSIPTAPPVPTLTPILTPVKPTLTLQATSGPSLKGIDQLMLSPDSLIEFVRIPAGKFLMGSDKNKDSLVVDDEHPQHNVNLPEYYISKSPITVKQFAIFAAKKNYKTIAEKENSGRIMNGQQFSVVNGANWQHPRGPNSNVNRKQNHPVTQVNWDDAMAFCDWASDGTGMAVRLPTEAEWEKAARGEDARIYTWGNQLPNSNLANYDMKIGDTTPVGTYSPSGDSPYGCQDMLGNVWEWTLSLHNKYPYQNDLKRDLSTQDRARVLRGGSFYYNEGKLRIAYRLDFPPNFSYYNIGFRVVMVKRDE